MNINNEDNDDEDNNITINIDIVSSKWEHGNWIMIIKKK